MLKLGTISICLLAVCLGACTLEQEISRPNVILIMADDMGYECLGVYGSLSYETPRLDALAGDGILFDRCISQPLCTPSRVKIMTGQYNYRNYEYFGYLNESNRTFGNVFRDAGYSTCIVGKWQLNGLAYREEIPDWSSTDRPSQMGFDEYCLWQLTHRRGEGERFANPLIESNGALLPRDPNVYGPDVFADYLLDFIDRKKDQSFFAYYPMVLVHEPFVPTPDTEAWQDPARRYEKDTAYFKDMVAYTDKIVGRIVDKLKEHGLLDNTLILFTGDNGTDRPIVSQTERGPIAGGKGKTIDAGTRVPLIAHWPAGGQRGKVHRDLIEFSDFYPTLAALVGDGEVSNGASDGRSLHGLLTGESYVPRETSFVHYDPMWGNFVNQFRNQFVRTTRYKLYANGLYYDLETDPLEEQPLKVDQLAGEAQSAHELLQIELSRHPAFTYDPEPASED